LLVVTHRILFKQMTLTLAFPACCFPPVFWQRICHRFVKHCPSVVDVKIFPSDGVTGKFLIGICIVSVCRSLSARHPERRNVRVVSGQFKRRLDAGFGLGNSFVNLVDLAVTSKRRCVADGQETALVHGLLGRLTAAKFYSISSQFPQR
jgi:hypothetical protein